MKNRVAGLLLMLPMSGLLAQPLFLWPGRPPRGTMLREAKPLDCSRLRAIAPSIGTTGRTWQKMTCCYAGRAARGSRQLWLPYLGRHRKFRGSGCALPVPSAEDRNEVQQPCTRPGPFQIIEGAAGTRFDCRPSGHLFFGGWPTLPTRGIQIQYVRPLL